MLNDLMEEEAKRLDLQACVLPRAGLEGGKEEWTRLMRREREAKEESLSVSSSRGAEGGGAPAGPAGQGDRVEKPADGPEIE